MPDLVIDEGNSSLKIGVFEGQTLQSNQRVFHISELEELIKQIQPDRGLISSVRDRDNSLVLGKKFPFDMVELSANTRVPIKIKYDTPDTLGMDRISSAIGANFEFPDNNLLVVDMGTCITADLVIEGTFIGGWILPGLKMQLKSMHEGTGKLPKVEMESVRDLKLVGASTKESMITGVGKGIGYGLNGLFHESQISYGNMVMVITGGDLEQFDSKIKGPIFARPNLNLTGLNRILNFNEQVS